MVRWELRAPDRTIAAATRFVRWPRLVTRWNPTWFGPTQASVGEWSGWYEDPQFPLRSYVVGSIR